MGTDPGTDVAAKATLADHVITTTFDYNKETDANYRFGAKPSTGGVAGSIYVPKSAMPAGTTKAIVTVRFE